MSVQEGDVVKGVVSDITHFGAFVKLETGEKGLVPISEIADTYVRNVSDYLSVGEEITVKVTAIKDRGKIDLSIRRLKQGTGDSAEKPSRAPSRKPPARSGPPRRHGGPPRASHSSPGDNFEDKLSSFLKKSQEKLTDVKKRKEKRSRGRRR